MGKRLKSMDVTIEDVTRTFEFDPPAKVSSDDEGEASLELLRDAETTEVVLVSGIDSVKAEVSYTYTVTGTVEVELDSGDLGDDFEDSDDIQSAIERGDFDSVGDAIRDDIEQNLDVDTYAQVDSVDVTAFDEDGEQVFD